MVNYFLKKDIRQYGSGNTGATNSFRVLGRPAGFIVTFFRYFQGIYYSLFSTMVLSSCGWCYKHLLYKWFNSRIVCNTRSRVSNISEI
ncbi:glycerol-3-phosphate acyltransferase [Staphylococcus epidermidis]